MFYRRSPLKRICLPRVLNCLLASPNRVKEVEQKYSLCESCHNRKYAYQHVHIVNSVEHRIVRILVITTRCTGYPNKVHWEEHSITSDYCQPEVCVPQFAIHHTPIHFWEPMINTREHSKYGR